jgi:hypothetical protein
MKNMAMIIGAVSCFSLSACTPTAGERLDSHLECAALISAATVLVSRGQAEQDSTLQKQGLVGLMTHLNSYAIPKGLREAEAFAELKALRSDLIGSLQPAAIMKRSNRCLRRISR